MSLTVHTRLHHGMAARHTQSAVGEPSLDEQVNKSFINKELCKCLDILPVREHDIIIMLFGIGMNPMSKQEVGDMFGIGVERVRQIKEKALDKIRKRCNLQLSKLI